MTAVPLSARAGESVASWSRRPVLSWVVRLSSILLPVAGSFAAAWSLTVLTPTPATWQIGVVRWIAIAIASSLALIGLERWTRRLLPVASLLDLTLAFPDQAPSRFRVALRTGTTGQLHRRISEIRSGAPSDPSVSAGQRVIELVAALSVHDRITRGHSERVRAYAQMIADEMRLDEEELDRLRWAALLHDVGKLLVPTSILNKDGRLTDGEFAIIKTHPENGRRIIEELIPWLGESARAVWEHHEKWDGSGYPHGLSGTDISLAARIVAVADVYDVMTSVRSYKEAVSPREAREELARCAGTHFDPQVVRAFLNVSLGRVRRTAGPLAWVSQLALFPTTVFGSAQAAGSAAVLSGALSASSVGVGAGLATDAWSALAPRDFSQTGAPVDALDEHVDAETSGVTIVTVPPQSGVRAPDTITTTITTTIATTIAPSITVAPTTAAPPAIAPPPGSDPTSSDDGGTPGSADGTSPPLPQPIVVTTTPPASNTTPVAPTTVPPATTLPPRTTSTTPDPVTTTVPPPTTTQPPPVTVAPTTSLPVTLPSTTLPPVALPSVTTLPPVVASPVTLPAQVELPPQARFVRTASEPRAPSDAEGGDPDEVPPGESTQQADQDRTQPGQSKQQDVPGADGPGSQGRGRP